MGKPRKILHSLQDLKVEDLKLEPKIRPGDTLVKALKGRREGDFGLVLEQRKDGKYRVGFFRRKWESIKDLPADCIDVEILLFFENELEIVG